MTPRRERERERERFRERFREGFREREREIERETVGPPELAAGEESGLVAAAVLAIRSLLPLLSTDRTLPHLRQILALHLLPLPWCVCV